jgi:hypothetical protein
MEVWRFMFGRQMLKQPRLAKICRRSQRQSKSSAVVTCFSDGRDALKHRNIGCENRLTLRDICRRDANQL